MKQLMFINGHWVSAKNKQVFEVCNPANGRVLGTVPLAAEADIQAAIDAAAAAQANFAAMGPFERGKLLRRASAIVEMETDEIALMMSKEQGKPKNEAVQEVKKAAETLRYYAEEGERVYGRIIANEESGFESRVVYQPIGPVGAITPWNYPVELLTWKLGGALAAGCTIVCKLPYETPLSPLMFIDCLARAGFPAGVVNAVTGPGAVLGPLMARNPKLKKIAFTGSTATGRSLFRQSADTLKKLSLELGGSAPAILCADCDLEEAVKGTVRRAFRNNGQICIAINRIYVERAIYEEYLEKFAFAVKKLSIGDGARETVDLGPMCTKTGLEKIMRHAEDARRKGARILTGGKAPSGEKYEHGTFYEPTVIADATQDMLVMREESFGPVVGVAPFDSLDEALVLANNSPYGLAGICFTSNLNTAQKVCRLLDAGNIAINNVDAGVMNAPYGGMKESGFGYEHGPEGLFEYLTAKHLRFKYGE